MTAEDNWIIIEKQNEELLNLTRLALEKCNNNSDIMLMLATELNKAVEQIQKLRNRVKVLESK